MATATSREPPGGKEKEATCVWRILYQKVPACFVVFNSNNKHAFWLLDQYELGERPASAPALPPPCQHPTSQIAWPPALRAPPAAGCGRLGEQWGVGRPGSVVLRIANRQDFVAEAGASIKSVGSWELFGWT
jgi:hypothetical protein